MWRFDILCCQFKQIFKTWLSGQWFQTPWRSCDVTIKVGSYHIDMWLRPKQDVHHFADYIFKHILWMTVAQNSTQTYCAWSNWRYGSIGSGYGLLTRYMKLPVVHAPGIPGTFSPPPQVIDPDKHHGTCAMHVPWCMSISLTSGFLWSRWRGKRSRRSRCIRNPQFYLSGKRPMVQIQVRIISQTNAY